MDDKAKISVICTVCVQMTQRYYDILVNKHLLGVMCDLLGIQESDLKRPINQFMCYRCLYTMEYVHEFRYFALQYIRNGETNPMGFRQPLIFKYIREDVLKEEKLPYCYYEDETDKEKSLLIPRQYEFASDPTSVVEYTLADKFERFYCSSCPKTFNKSRSLSAHERYHRKQERRSRSRSVSRNRSRSRCSSQLEYSCIECSEIFPSRMQLKKHMKEHAEKLMCRLCEKASFFNSNDRHWHEAVCPSRLTTEEEQQGPRTRSRSRLGNISRSESRCSVTVEKLAHKSRSRQRRSPTKAVIYVPQRPEQSASQMVQVQTPKKKTTEKKEITKDMTPLKNVSVTRPLGEYATLLNIPRNIDSQIVAEIDSDIGVNRVSRSPKRTMRPNFQNLNVKGIRPTPTIKRSEILNQEWARIKLQQKYQVNISHCTVKTCDFKHQCLDTVVRHEVDVHGKLKWFPCNICRKEFTDGSLLALHKNQFHPTGPIMCPVCDKVYTNTDDLVEHSIEHYYKCYPCSACDAQLPSVESLKWHWFEAVDKRHTTHDTITVTKLIRGAYLPNPDDDTDNENVVVKRINIEKPNRNRKPQRIRKMQNKQNHEDTLCNVEKDSEFSISEVQSLCGTSRCSTPFRPNSRCDEFLNPDEIEEGYISSRSHTPYPESIMSSSDLYEYPVESVSEIEFQTLHEPSSPPTFIVSDIQTLMPDTMLHSDETTEVINIDIDNGPLVESYI